MARSVATAGLVLLAVLFSSSPASAHDLNAGLLELRALGGDRYTVTFKISRAAGSREAGIEPLLPTHCRALTTPQRYAVPRGVLSRWMVHCPGGLAGARIAARWGDSQADVLLRIDEGAGRITNAVLTSARPALFLSTDGKPTRGRLVREYAALGIEHILLGYDHLLFLLCLLVLCRRRAASLVLAVTAFTIGHSLSLALVTVGVVGLPLAPVEAIIAMSVVFLAAVLARPGEWGSARPWTFAVLFGVLHGFGFAGALADIGLAHGEIPLALVSFNIGVEIGQLGFVLVALGAALALERMRVPVTRSRVLPYAIGSVAMFWLMQRVAAFWSGGIS